MDYLARGDPKNIFLKQKNIRVLGNPLFKDSYVIQTSTLATFAEPKAKTSLATSH